MRYWLLFGTALFLMGFFIAPTPNSHKTIFYLMVLLPFLIFSPKIIKKVQFKDPVILGFSVLLLYLTSAVFWGELGDLSTSGFLKRTLFIVAFLFTIIWIINEYPNFIEGSLLALAACSFLIGIWLIIDFYILESRSLARLFSPDWRFRNQNHMAKAYGFIILLSLYAIFTTHYSRLKWAFLFPIGMAAFVIIMSKSSGALLAIILSIPLLLLATPQLRSATKRNAAWILAALILVAAILYFSGILNHHLKSGWAHRDVIWLSILQDQSINKIFGVGFLNDATVTGFNNRLYGHEHNLFIALYRQSGLLGVFLYSAFICLLFIKSNKKDPTTLLLWILLAYGLLTTMPGGKYPIQRVNDTWLMTWVPIVFLIAKHHIFSRKSEQQNTHSEAYRVN